MANGAEIFVRGQRSFLNAVKWAYILTWGEKGISAILFFLLAGLLGPADFGTVAIATVYIGFLQMFLDQGLLATIIQRKEIDQRHLNAVFWTNLALSLVLVGLSLIFGRYWAELTHAPQASSVIDVLSISIILEGLSIVQNAILRREMNFRALSIRTNTSIFLSGLVGVGMALFGFGVWSLVSQQLFRDVLALVILWRMSPWRPNFSFSLHSLHELLGFSVASFFGHLANFADLQASSVVLGALFGPAAVGLFKLVEKAAVTVISISSGSIRAVSYPQFSYFQDNLSELQNSILTAVRVTAIMSLPALSGLAIISGSLMAAIGPAWLPASDGLKVLCVTEMGMVFAGLTGPLLYASGRPGRASAMDWGRTIAGFAALIAAGSMVENAVEQYQVLAIATARFCVAVLIVPIFISVLLRQANLSLSEFVGQIIPSVLSAIAVASSVELFIQMGKAQGLEPIVTLLEEIAVGAFGGLATLLVADRQVRRIAGIVVKWLLVSVKKWRSPVSS